ncbi:MAG TPA: undecaprenyl-diphosphate phosphatase, partial [Acetobacteraceae bacterium]
MNTIQSILIALLQGATELFPVSSLGHAVVVPALAHWQIDQRDPSFLPFLVMLHLGTAAALLLYFWRDWWTLAIGVLGLDQPHQVQESRRVFGLIVVATIPAVIVGGLLEHFFRRLFGDPVVAATFLIVNGVLLLG